MWKERHIFTKALMQCFKKETKSDKMSLWIRALCIRSSQFPILFYVYETEWSNCSWERGKWSEQSFSPKTLPSLECLYRDAGTCSHRSNGGNTPAVSLEMYINLVARVGKLLKKRVFEMTGPYCPHTMQVHLCVCICVPLLISIFRFSVFTAYWPGY